MPAFNKSILACRQIKNHVVSGRNQAGTNAITLDPENTPVDRLEWAVRRFLARIVDEFGFRAMKRDYGLRIQVSANVAGSVRTMGLPNSQRLITKYPHPRLGDTRPDSD